MILFEKLKILGAKITPYPALQMKCADKQIVKIDNPFSIPVFLKLNLNSKELLLKLTLITFNTNYDIAWSYETLLKSGILFFCQPGGISD